MAPLTVDRNTSQQELGNLYLDNCSYSEGSDVEMAKRSVTICTAMMRRGMTRFESAGGTTVNFAPSVLQNLIRDAMNFVSVRNSREQSPLAESKNNRRVAHLVRSEVGSRFFLRTHGPGF